MGSYTTTNYSVTTAATSILSPHYHINTKKITHFRQSTLSKHDQQNLLKEEEEKQRALEKEHEAKINAGAICNDEESSELDLKLDEENPEQFFKNLHNFRKSFIERRRASGVHDLDDQTAFSAPPESQSEEEYHRRLHTLDLDEIDYDTKLNLNSEDRSPSDSDTQTNDNKTPKNDDLSDDIAPPHDSDHDINKRKVHHAIEGSRELGIDDIGIINNSDDEDSKSLSYQDDLDDEEPNTNLDEQRSGSILTGDMLNGKDHGRSGSIKWIMSRDRESSKIFASGQIMAGSDEDNQDNDGNKHIKGVSISKKKSLDDDGNVDENHLQFDIDVGPNDNNEEMDEFKDDIYDDSQFMKLRNHFSVERPLHAPRGSMKVSRISVSDELRETLKHQQEITNSAQNIKDPNEPSPPTSISSFDGQRQAAVGDYVKRVSLTPRGIDPDNAKVSVMFKDANDNIIVESEKEEIHYHDREYLKGKNSQHRRTDSMDTQPDNNDQAPYINKQLTVLIREEVQANQRKEQQQQQMNQFQYPSHEEQNGGGGHSASPGPPNLGSRQDSVLIRQESAQFYDHNVADMGLQFDKSYNSLMSQSPNGNGNIDENDNDNNNGSGAGDGNETNEGWEQPTGYEQEEMNGDNDERSPNLLLKTPRSGFGHNEEEKYDELLSPRMNGYNHRTNTDSSDDDDGYEETTRGGPSMMTMGGNMLNVLRFIPWNENEYLPQELDESFEERTIPRFSINQQLNETIRFHWDGDALLKSDAIVIPITENWTPISQESHMLMNNAGPEYLEYIYSIKKLGEYISTGDCEQCASFNLPCKWIIHTCPPRYENRYPVASENAMNSCVWRSLEIACDLNCKTIVFPSIYPPKFFSEQLAIHILSRTLRRFLERYQSVSFKSVVICVDNEEQMQLYTRIFTIYFPRDDIDLKYSQKYMPAYTGNISGGTVVKLRKHDIELSPLVYNTMNNNNNQNVMLPNNSNIALINKNHIDYETYDIYGNLRPAIQCMVEYKVEPEKVWKQQESKKWGWQKVEESFNIRYKRYWNRCRKLNLMHIQLHQFVYVGGKDENDRDIIIFVGNRFPAKQLMQQKKLKESLLYIIRELHHIVDRDYIVIYLHSYVNEEQNLPPVSWINQCFQICSNRFNKNLNKFFIIHPNFRLKSWFYVLATKSFYQKIIYLDSMTKLEHYNIDLEHIALPGKSWEYEREIFGEDKLVDKMALTSDDLVLDALPYR